METESIICKNEDDIQIRLNQKARRKDMAKRVMPFAGLALVFVFFLLATQGALVEADNLDDILNQCFTITVVAVGSSFVYALGAFDISIGAVMALSELVIVFAIKAGGVPIPVLLLIGIGVAVGITFITSVASSVLKVPTFIASFCMMFVCTGIVITVASQQKLYIPLADYNFINEPLIKAISLAVVLIAGFVVFNKTRLGKDVKAMGGNEVAAVQSGIRKVRTYILAFVCLGITVGVAGFFSLMRTSAVNSSSGTSLGLNIMVAIVLGGFPLTGGANARMLNAIVGALTITLLQNGLLLMSIANEYNLLLQSLIFIAVVAITYDRSKGRFVL